MNCLDLASRRVVLRKASSTKGGEWHGPCPLCGGEDRFHVWPQENEGLGSWWCRGCGRGGDAIQYLRDVEGLSYAEACAELGLKRPDRPRDADTSGRTAPRPIAPPPWEPPVPGDPAGAWQQRAEAFVAWAASHLSRCPEVLADLQSRGIGPEAVQACRLGWNPGENHKDLYRPRSSWGLEEVLRDDGRPKALWLPRGLVIPCLRDGVVRRIRIRRPDGEPRYYVLPGSAMDTLVLGPERRGFIVVESELDALACFFAQDRIGAVALGSAQAKPDARAFPLLEGALVVLLALDYDRAGAGAGAWWRERFPRLKRWPVPAGKDPGDAVRMGTDLGAWIREGLPPALTLGLPEVRTPAPDLRHAEPEPLRSPEPDLRRPDAPSPAKRRAEIPQDLPDPVRELVLLLRENPGVRIYNTPERYTVLRNGKYVSGRINELVFRTPAVTDWLLAHPLPEIDGGNILNNGGN